MAVTKKVNLYKVANDYIEKILASDRGENSTSIRVLLLDKDTAPIISLVSTQSNLLKKEVYLVERLESETRDKLRNLKCICFLKPSDLTITKLAQEINNPKYSSYDIYFNNVISKSRLERLAEADDLEIVHKVVEVFQDYYVLNKSFFTATNAPNPLLASPAIGWDPAAFQSSIDSLLSFILSLNIKPTIRYENNSKMAFKLANAMKYEIESSNSQLFDNIMPRSNTEPMVLILDRKNDPITPLLFPWTYQSMIHEMLTINNTNNTVDLSHLSSVGEELKTVIMNEIQDPFYEKCMYSNFGDLSSRLKEYVDDYKQKTKTNSNISSIKDMKFFLENYPEFKKISLNLSKHMLLTSEIDKQIHQKRIWETSEFEQDMCSTPDLSHHDSDLQELERFLHDKASRDGTINKPIPEDEKLRLLSLYAIKYENHASCKTKDLLETLNNPKFSSFIPLLLKYCGSQARMAGEEGQIFNKLGNNGGSTNQVAALFNNFSRNSNSDNAYMQHQPRLVNVLQRLLKTKTGLSDNLFPSVNTNNTTAKVPRDVVVFVIGGVCYEEVRFVYELNQNNEDFNIMIGGTNTLNSNTFINNLIDSST